MKSVCYPLIWLLGSAFLIPTDSVHVYVKNESFGRGERLEYKLNFAFITVGKAVVKIQETLHRINHRDCYKIDVYGKTSGLIDWIAQVDDHWGAYVDTASIVPHISFRKIKEGKFRKNEIIRFDHITNNIEAKVMDNKTGEWKEPKYWAAPDNIRDILGGYLYIRTIDFEAIPEGDTLTIQGFYEDTLYDLELIYAGKDQVKTKAGKFNAIKLIPVMPDNKLFDGDNSVTIWLSDDANKMPLKVEAEMFIGHAGVELMGYKGLRNPLNSYQ